MLWEGRPNEAPSAHHHAVRPIACRGAELANGSSLVPNASVRFFRVSATVNQQVVPGLLLGETTSDDKGNYAIVLPAK